jgi:hypothetical protein
MFIVVYMPVCFVTGLLIFDNHKFGAFTTKKRSKRGSPRAIMRNIILIFLSNRAEIAA